MPRKKPTVEYHYVMCSDGIARRTSPFAPLPESMLPPRLRKPVVMARNPRKSKQQARDLPAA